MEYVNQATTALAPLGLSLGGLAAAIGTIIASFLAAKFGASESKRQYSEKTALEKLVAAGELIQLLYRFQDALSDIMSDNENYKSSDGHEGEEHYGFGNIDFTGKPHRLAAVLGPRIVEDVILLMSKYAIAKGTVASAWEVTDPSSASEEVQAWSAALVLNTFELINAVSSQAGIRISAKPSMRDEWLLKTAGHRGKDYEYAELVKY